MAKIHLEDELSRKEIRLTTKAKKSHTEKIRQSAEPKRSPEMINGEFMCIIRTVQLEEEKRPPSQPCSLVCNLAFISHPFPLQTSRGLIAALASLLFLQVFQDELIDVAECQAALT